MSADGEAPQGDAGQPGNRRSRGGRAAKRVQRAAARAAPQYITRRIPCHELLVAWH